MVLGFTPLTAFAGQGLPCETPLMLGGAQASAPVEKVHQLVAMPGAFGGDVTCVLDAESGQVEQYWAEFLPKTASTREHVLYQDGKISYFLGFLAADGPTKEVVACTQRTGGGLACRVDLAAGEGLLLARFFGPDLAFKGVRVMALPENGVVSPTVWSRISGKVADGTAQLEMDLALNGSETRWPLTRQEESRPGHPVMGISGESAAAFMQKIYTGAPEVVLETRVTTQNGEQFITTTARHRVTAGNLSYLIDKLAKVEHLMVTGFEKSKDMKF